MERGYISEYSYPIKKDVKGKKTRNPGYLPGNHWVACDRCGIAVRSKDAMKTWDDLVVCPNDWEPRHPQDFVRGVEDVTAAQGLVNSEPSDLFASSGYQTPDSIFDGGSTASAGGGSGSLPAPDLDRVAIDNLTGGDGDGPRIVTGYPVVPIWRVTFTSNGYLIYWNNVDGTVAINKWYLDAPISNIGQNFGLCFSFAGGGSMYQDFNFTTNEVSNELLSKNVNDPASYVSLATDYEIYYTAYSSQISPDVWLFPTIDTASGYACLIAEAGTATPRKGIENTSGGFNFELDFRVTSLPTS